MARACGQGQDRTVDLPLFSEKERSGRATAKGKHSHHARLVDQIWTRRDTASWSEQVALLHTYSLRSREP